MKRLIWTSMVVALSWWSCSALLGQGPPPGRLGPGGAAEDGGDMHGGGRHGRFSRRGGGDRASRLEGFLQSLDANGNGIIEPSEIPPERAGMVEYFARRMGLDPSQPIQIARIRELMGGGPPGGNPPATPPATSPAENKPDAAGGAGASKTDEAAPLVPGFGTSEVRGFGEQLSASAGATASQAGAGQLSDSQRAYREARFRRYDRNRDGVLDREESGRLREDPTALDRNRDGRITLEEYVSAAVSPVGAAGGRPGAPRGEQELTEVSKSEKDGRKSYRFLQPHERLPEGLPDWFVDRDKNGDGQVSMAEYASSWSNATAEGFEDLDLNDDGFVTPKECLKAGGTKPESQTTAASSEPTKTKKATKSGGESTPWWMR